MNAQKIVDFVNSLLEQYRVEIGDRPTTTPVEWKGIHMSVDEAKLIIKTLEKEKRKQQRGMNGAQVGGEITKLATGGAGLAAVVTGVALTVFPLTMPAGVAVLASGIGAAGIGQMVGEGVSKIGTNVGMQEIQQLDAYIDTIKNAIINSI